MSIILNGFPTADESARKSIIGGLKDLLHKTDVATSYGYTSVTTTKKKEIALIFHNEEVFENMGYDVTYDYDEDSLDWDVEDAWVEDLLEAKLDWTHKVHKSF